MNEKKPDPGADDLLVPLGNLAGKTIAHLRAVLADGDPVMQKNYEDSVEDFIQDFNQQVTQGVPPEWALFNMTQAYAIVLGNCLRAGFDAKEAGKLLRIIIENAQTSKDLIQQVTILNEASTKQ